MLLAGDVGGTKTLLGLFEPDDARPCEVAVRSFVTLDYHDLPSMLAAFFALESTAPTDVDRASFGVAGPVLGEMAELTNVPWRVDAREVKRVFGIPSVALLNDLQAMAYGVTVLQPSEVHTLQQGRADPNGNVALIAAGTGLGEALLHRVDG